MGCESHCKSYQFHSTPRESLGGKTPYEAALETLGEDILKAFQLKPIALDEVNLTPSILYH